MRNALSDPEPPYGVSLRLVPDSVVFVRTSGSGPSASLSMARVVDGSLSYESWPRVNPSDLRDIRSAFKAMAADCHVMVAHGAPFELRRLRGIHKGSPWSEPHRRCTLAAAHLLLPGRIRGWSLLELLPLLAADLDHPRSEAVPYDVLGTLSLSVMLHEIWRRDRAGSSMLSMFDEASVGWRMRAALSRATASCSGAGPATEKQVRYIQRLVRRLDGPSSRGLSDIPPSSEWTRGQASAAISVLQQILPSTDSQQAKVRSAMSSSGVRFIDLSMAMPDGRRASRIASLSMAQASLAIDMMSDSDDPQWDMTEWTLPADSGVTGSSLQGASLSEVRRAAAGSGPVAGFSALLLSALPSAAA